MDTEEIKPIPKTKLDKIAESKLYRLSPVIVGLALAAIVAAGITKGLDEQLDDGLKKPDTQVTHTIEDSNK